MGDGRFLVHRVARGLVERFGEIGPLSSGFIIGPKRVESEKFKRSNNSIQNYIFAPFHPLLPVIDIGYRMHSRNIQHGIKCSTSFVEIRILSN